MADATQATIMTSPEVRDRLVEALELDLVGPWPGHDLDAERLPGWVRPSNWYLCGFLIPTGTPPEKASDPDGIPANLRHGPAWFPVRGEHGKERHARFEISPGDRTPRRAEQPDEQAGLDAERQQGECQP